MPARFWLRHGFHPGPATRVLPLVVFVRSGSCGALPQYAGYALSWTRRSLTITMLLRPLPPPPAGILCPLYVYVRYMPERVTLPRPLGDRELLDGATKPPSAVHTLPAGLSASG